MFSIIRALKTKFHTSKKNLGRLFACNRGSAQVWNDCLRLAKEHFQRTGKWIDRRSLHYATKGQYPIHSQSIQAVFEKYLDARNNARQARVSGHTQIRYPYKEKQRFNTKWKKEGFRILENGKIELSLGLFGGKRQKGNKHKRSPRHNQKMSQWQYGRTTGYLQYKLGAEGISLQKVDEAYTTQTCPVCGRRKRTSSRNYSCLCGYQEHRDIHGAKNILTKYKYGEFRKISLTEHKYLRIA